MTRDTSYLKRTGSIDDPNLFIPDTEGSDEATMTTSSTSEIFTCRQYVVFSATFQVPCFYFNMYDYSK